MPTEREIEAASAAYHGTPLDPESTPLLNNRAAMKRALEAAERARGGDNKLDQAALEVWRAGAVRDGADCLAVARAVLKVYEINP